MLSIIRTFHLLIFASLVNYAIMGCKLCEMPASRLTRYLSEATLTRIRSSPTRTFSPSDRCLDAGWIVHQQDSPSHKTIPHGGVHGDENSHGNMGMEILVGISKVISFWEFLFPFPWEFPWEYPFPLEFLWEYPFPWEWSSHENGLPMGISWE